MGRPQCIACVLDSRMTHSRNSGGIVLCGQTPTELPTPRHPLGFSYLFNLVEKKLSGWVQQEGGSAASTLFSGIKACDVTAWHGYSHLPFPQIAPDVELAGGIALAVVTDRVSVPSGTVYIIAPFGVELPPLARHSLSDNFFNDTRAWFRPSVARLASYL